MKKINKKGGVLTTYTSSLIQDNQAYVLNSHSIGQNAAYGVSNKETNGGYIANNTYLAVRRR